MILFYFTLCYSSLMKFRILLIVAVTCAWIVFKVKFSKGGSRGTPQGHPRSLPVWCVRKQSCCAVNDDNDVYCFMRPFTFALETYIFVRHSVRMLQGCWCCLRLTFPYFAQWKSHPEAAVRSWYASNSRVSASLKKVAGWKNYVYGVWMKM